MSISQRNYTTLEYYTAKSPEIRFDYLQESPSWLRIGLLSHWSTEFRIPVNEVQEALSLSYGIRKTPPSSGAFRGGLVEMVDSPTLCGTPQHRQIHLKLAKHTQKKTTGRPDPAPAHSYTLPRFSANISEWVTWLSELLLRYFHTSVKDRQLFKLRVPTVYILSHHTISVPLSEELAPIRTFYRPLLATPRRVPTLGIRHKYSNLLQHGNP